MEGIEKIILKMLPNQESRNDYLIYSLQKKWNKICGVNIAKHSKPVKLERKVLYINTDSSVWSNHLLLMKQQFLNNINNVINNNTVKDLKFFTGSIENFFNHECKEEKEVFLLENLTDDEKNQIYLNMKNINNQKLQRNLVKFKTVCLKREKTFQKKGQKECITCGVITSDNSNLCRVCKRYEKDKLRQKLVEILLCEPWLVYENCQNYLKCDRITFDSVKNSLCLYYYNRVRNEHADTRERNIAVYLKTTISPEKMTEELFEKTMKELRGK